MQSFAGSGQSQSLQVFENSGHKPVRGAEFYERPHAHNCFESYLTKKQLAEKLGISEAYINKLMKYEGLPNTKIGRAVRYRLGDVASWLQKRSRP